MKKVLVIFLLTAVLPGLFAFGKKDTPPGASGTDAKQPAGAVVILGRVRIYGSEPHTYVGIETQDGKYYAISSPEKEKEIWNLQGRLVEFTVFLSSRGSLFLRDGTVTPLSWRTVD
ncbi:MAG: hypothetical protein LBS64_01130 [Spirochaetaceae bacterium]|jgi:hypothetical protein|nr:hypothetical protein [Spirochaetaceae bacterium]